MIAEEVFSPETVVAEVATVCACDIAEQWYQAYVHWKSVKHSESASNTDSMYAVDKKKNDENRN